MVNDLDIDLNILPVGTVSEVSEKVLKVYNDYTKNDNIRITDSDIKYLVSSLNYSFELRGFLETYGFEFINYSTLGKPCIKLIKKENYIKTLNGRTYPIECFQKAYSLTYDDSLDSMRLALEASMGLPEGFVFGKRHKQDELKDILRSL